MNLRLSPTDRPHRFLPLALAGFALALALSTSVARADGCQDDVDDLRKEIKQERDRYRKDAVEEALEHLRKAEFHRLNPLECREEIFRARKALTKGLKVGD